MSVPPVIPISAFEITEDDANDIPEAEHCIGIYVGTTGTLRLQDKAGNECTFTGVPAGVVIWGRWKRIMAASGASTLVAYYDAIVKKPA